MKRKPKVITDTKVIEEIASVQEEEITTTYIMKMFGEFNGVARFHPYDEITIPAGFYGLEKKNKKPFTTTVGIYIWNKYFIEKELFDLFKYINNSITKKFYSKLNDDLSYALMEDKINIDQFKRFQMKTQKVMAYSSVLSPSYTDKMMTCTAEINKKKAQLVKKYKKEIEAGDELIATKIEKELLDFALDYLDGDPAMDIYLSGAGGSIGNNFKNMYIMKGAVKNPDPNAKQKYRIATSNYADGIKPEEYVIFADSLAAGPFSRAKKTEVGGYLEKVFLYAYQHVKLDPPGSDCKTKRVLPIKLTKDNIKEWMYSYVVQGDKLIEITSDNKDKFIDKNVKLRFSALCESKTGICNKCFGNLPYRRGTTNSGIESTIIASTMKNVSMKSFHDSVQQFTEIDIMKAFGLS